MLPQQAWNNVDFAKNASSWVALLGNSLVQPRMKVSEFQCGTTQSHGGVDRTDLGTNMYHRFGYRYRSREERLREEKREEQVREEN